MHYDIEALDAAKELARRDLDRASLDLETAEINYKRSKNFGPVTRARERLAQADLDLRIATEALDQATEAQEKERITKLEKRLAEAGARADLNRLMADLKADFDRLVKVDEELGRIRSSIQDKLAAREDALVETLALHGELGTKPDAIDSYEEEKAVKAAMDYVVSARGGELVPNYLGLSSFED